MNISTIGNNFNIRFSGANKEQPKMTRTPEEHFKHFTGLIFNNLLERSEREVPENGQFTPISASYNIPNSENRAMLAIECDLTNPKTSRRISAVSCRKDSDKLVKSFIFKGTKQEVINYLKDEKNRETFIKTVRQLSDSLDSKE